MLRAIQKKKKKMMTKPERSYISALTHNRSWSTIRNNSRIQKRKQQQQQRRWWKQQLREQEKRRSRRTERSWEGGGGGEHNRKRLTVSLKWSLCLPWTASVKCWSLGCGRRFSSSRMSRIPTNLASTRSEISNLASRRLRSMFKTPPATKH